jgi:hypothetical protein
MLATSGVALGPLQFDAKRLVRLAIPPAVVEMSQQSVVGISTIGIAGLPHPLDTASVWIACRSAWPHQDPDFDDQAFLTLAMLADHECNECLPGGQVRKHAVSPGTLFLTNPLHMHWLRPRDLKCESGFVGLQWEVQACDAETSFLRLAHDLRSYGAQVCPEVKVSGLILEVPDY